MYDQVRFDPVDFVYSTSSISSKTTYTSKISNYSFGEQALKEPLYSQVGEDIPYQLIADTNIDGDTRGLQPKEPYAAFVAGLVTDLIRFDSILLETLPPQSLKRGWSGEGPAYNPCDTSLRIGDIGWHDIVIAAQESYESSKITSSPIRRDRAHIDTAPR